MCAEKYVTYVFKEVNMQFFIKAFDVGSTEWFKRMKCRNSKYQLYVRSISIFLTELLIEKFKYNSLQKKGKTEDIFWIIHELKN